MTPTAFKEWRQRLGWSQSKAAEALGISRSRLADYEAGRTLGRNTPAPIPRHVELACRALAELPQG